MKTKIKGQYRQGDVLVEEISITPSFPGKPVNKLILAHGEVTGHCHSVEDCVTFEDGMFSTTCDTAVVHQEHTLIPLKANRVYRSIRQREYTPGMIRSVAD